MNVPRDAAELGVVADQVIETFGLPERLAGAFECLIRSLSRNGFQAVHQFG